ncbi:MraY family glycosyltransferase [Wenzhouxiangella sp. EGI_FJ10409]|uniref:MraY family glycosyltransferase n=1 Tax=Wenzhouxiangella sp. EGI_FJ10409 TaxID=3243767 RepID=UPI0035DE7206
MGEMTFASITALVSSALIILLCRTLAPSLGLVDHPCNRRRHARTTPVVGGLGIAVGFLLSLLLLEPFNFHADTLLAGIGLLAIVGVIDDIHDLRTFWRLLAQLAAVMLVVVYGELQVQFLGNLFGFGAVGLWVFSGVFTVLCVMLMINAVNMLDGVDGLAGGVSLVTLAGFSLVLFLDGSAAWIMPFLLGLAVGGFLPYNMRGPWRKNASVFMGDSGSTILGFALAWLAIYATQTESAGIYPVTVAWMLVLPAADALSLFFRRCVRGRSPLSADRWHLHHIFIRGGWSVAITVNRLLLLQSLLVAVGIGGWWLGLPEWLMFWPLAAFFVGYQVAMWRADRVLRLLRRYQRRKRVRAERGPGAPEEALKGSR